MAVETPTSSPVRVEQRFRELEAEWKADTDFLSSYSAIVGHRAFRAIIALGMDVVPLMLLDLERGPSQWVWALPEITGENPIAPEDAGRIDRMGAAWLRWGRERGYR